jgi:hypothetical protein
MQQYTFDVLIQEKEEKFNMSKREKVVPRYRSTSHFYYWTIRKIKSLNKELIIFNL